MNSLAIENKLSQIESWFNIKKICVLFVVAFLVMYLNLKLETGNFEQYVFMRFIFLLRCGHICEVTFQSILVQHPAIDVYFVHI